MTQLELFAGIGGFGLAGHWAGIETVCQVEIDPFCQKVLAKNFPNAHRHDDIHTFDGTKWRGVDIVSGGFPCQPYSTAGKRLGTADERHLWPEMLRVIREAQPRYVVGENVGGLVSWSDGLVFEQVCVDLEAEGYEVQPFILPACAVNAPHRRDRVWFVAHANGGANRDNRKQDRKKDGVSGVDRQEVRPWKFDGANTVCHAANPTSKQDYGQKPRGFFANTSRSFVWSTTNPNSAGRPQLNPAAFANRSGFGSGVYGKESWSEWTSEPPICRMDDGLPAELHFIRKIENEIKSSNQEGKPEGRFVIWKAMRTMWENRPFAEAPSELFIRQMSDTLSIVPCESRPIGWLQNDEKGKELYRLWQIFYSKSFEKSQNVQQRLLDYYRQIERAKKMEDKHRNNRIKALGNAIVPQIAYLIFKSIIECDKKIQ